MIRFYITFASTLIARQAMLLWQLLLLVSCLTRWSNAAAVLVHPESRLVAPGVQVVFCCVLNNTEEPHWVVNDRIALSPQQKSDLLSEGYMIDEIIDGSVATLTVKVNATRDKNNSEVFCSSYISDISSKRARLLIINASPLAQNPSVVNGNESFLKLQWSPPFLWPGEAIQYYNVFVTNEERESVYHRVNTTFSDAVVSLTVKTLLDQICRELEFSISAVSYSDTKLPPFTVHGGYLPSITNASSLGVNVTTLLTEIKETVLIVNIMLSQINICSYQDLNYTMNFITQTNTTTTTLGPYLHRGYNTITHLVTSGIEENLEYYLVVNIETATGVIASEGYYFNTEFQQYQCVDNFNKVATYKVALVVCASVIGAVLLTVIMVGTVAICIKCRSTVSRVNESMVHNPIYEGSFYDSVQNVPNADPSKSTAATPGNTIGGSRTSRIGTNNKFQTGIQNLMLERSQESLYVDATSHMESTYAVLTSSPEDCTYASPSASKGGM